MLPQSNRLKNKKDFDRVYQKGRGFRQDFLTLRVVKNDLESTRIGFVVSSKVSKKAVARNKVKRRLREIARARIKDAKKGLDVIVSALPKADLKSFKETEQAMDGLMKKAKILN